ncbi:hypothetical protein [Nocardioides ferulae]|uniref:hypothetical protein n=1 Tax=Nocardioides ferulae TaxID=2340821 RepID=UPI000EB2F4E9|nr:hypothetical protein [Nocardioides ferulae]
MSAVPVPLSDADPFELPDWLGTDEVTWVADSGLRSAHLVAGRLTGVDGAELACDLLAVDDAYPVPVADDTARARAHQAWQHGQVLLVEREGRLTLAVPGTTFTADDLLDALSRLARAVGGSPERYAARLRIGRESGTRGR